MPEEALTSFTRIISDAYRQFVGQA